MDEITYRHIKQWFLDYSEAFRDRASGKDRANMELKVRHTLMVEANALTIAEEEWPEGTLLARTVGLLHDVGRFEQFERYRTFSDAESVNHGSLGVSVINEHSSVWGLSDPEMEAIKSAVGYHNSYAIPPDMKGEALMCLRVVRDADKLDIWRVLADFFELPESERDVRVVQGLREGPACSKGALEAIGQGRLVPLSVLGNVNDMRLMQLSWAFDINFSVSCRLARDKGDLRRIASWLPFDEPEVARALDMVFLRLDECAERMK